MLRWLSQVWPISYLFWRKIKLPKRPPLVPTFELPETLASGEFIYNPDFYATKETALAIQRKFSALVLFSKPIQDVDRAAPPQWTLRFTDGTEVNAGLLAKFFAEYPEDKYPGVALQWGARLVGMERAIREAERRQLG